MSFDVGEGEFLALIGPNGAGKSTCFNMINGQLAPDRGDIRFDGPQHRRACTPREIWRRGVGRTFQVAATFGSMTVVENVQMALVSHHGEIFRFGAAFARSPSRPRRSSCSTRSAWRTPPTAPARNSPTAT